MYQVKETRRQIRRKIKTQLMEKQEKLREKYKKHLVFDKNDVTSIVLIKGEHWSERSKLPSFCVSGKPSAAFIVLLELQGALRKKDNYLTTLVLGRGGGV